MLGAAKDVSIFPHRELLIPYSLVLPDNLFSGCALFLYLPFG